MRRLIPLCLLLALFLAGCGGDDGGQTVPTATVALAQEPAAEGEIVVRGEASPESHGPFAFAGRYRVRFEQFAPEDPDLDFSTQTPLVVEVGKQEGVPQRKVLQAAAAEGEKTVTLDGRLFVEVSFGDFPYAVRFTPVG